MDMAYCAQKKNFFLHKTAEPRAYSKVFPVDAKLEQDKVTLYFLQKILKIEYLKKKAFKKIRK